MSGPSRPAMRKQAYGPYDQRSIPSNVRQGTSRQANPNGSIDPTLFPPRFMGKMPTTRPSWDLGDISIPIRKRRRDGGPDDSVSRLMHPAMSIRSRRAPIPIPQAGRAARKLDLPLVSKGARKYGQEDSRAHSQIARKSTAGKAARKLEPPSRMHAEANELEYSSPEEDSGVPELTAALTALTISGLRLKEYKRLPFLCRNVRRGFKMRCRKAGVRTQPKEGPEGHVKVLYRYCLDDESESDASSSSDEVELYEDWMGGMLQWLCPLCQVHGEFDTREMLVFHLSRDHGNVKVTWTQSITDNKPAWQITLIIPDIESSDSESEDDDDDDNDDDETVTKSEDRFDEALLLSETPPTTESFSTPHPTLPEYTQTPRVTHEPAETSAPSITVPMELFPPSPFKIQHKFRGHSPSPATPTISASRSLSITDRTDRTRTLSTRGSLPVRYPSPPPPEDRLGPAARPPYEFVDGRPLYSCRIGGPRVYDVLNELPMDKFGVLSWAIVDREEELFEMDDILDEDKVILALWNRWIMLNRPAFVFDDYAKGVINFIDEYWRTIHFGAGWGALHAFLLMLVALRFLTLEEVVRILKHYETHTGMDYWYKDGLDEDSL